MQIKIRKWAKHQHYKDRNPPWIKIHKTLIMDPDFMGLSDSNKWLLIAFWLFASGTCDMDGVIEYEERDFAFFLRTKNVDLDSIIKTGLLQVLADDSTMLAGDTTALAREEKRRDREETETETKASEVSFTPQDLMDLWNSTIGDGPPKIIKLSDKRKKSARARIKDHPEETFWQGIIESINSSPFLLGEEGKWSADFDWILNENNLLKIQEGKYADKGNGQGFGRSNPPKQAGIPLYMLDK